MCPPSWATHSMKVELRCFTPCYTRISFQVNEKQYVDCWICHFCYCCFNGNIASQMWFIYQNKVFYSFKGMDFCFLFFSLVLLPLPLLPPNRNTPSRPSCVKMTISQQKNTAFNHIYKCLPKNLVFHQAAVFLGTTIFSAVVPPYITTPTCASFCCTLHHSANQLLNKR